MTSRRTSPRRCCGRIIRRGRTANSLEPGMTHFDQPGLGSLFLLPNESSSSKTSFWAAKGLVQMLLCSPVLSFLRQTKHLPPGWAPLSPLQDSQGCCAPFPDPILPAWESRGVQVLTDSVPALCICILLSHSQGRAAEHFPAPPRTEPGLIGRFLPYQSWACGSLEVDSTAPLAGLCQKAHLERGGRKKTKSHQHFG